MNPSEKQKLLAKVLPGDDLADFERASLERGLACLRQQRRRGYLVRASALAVVGGIITLGLLVGRHDPLRVSSSGPQVSPRPTPATSGHVKMISDDELLALFPGRSVALIGKPGQQRLVFLDQSKNEPAAAPF